MYISLLSLFCRILFLTLLVTYGRGDLTLSTEDFSKEIVKDDRVWIVEFYSAMCGSCKEFTPTWEKLEFSLKSKVVLGKVNIDDQNSMKLAQSLGVLDEGIPCIRLYTSKSDDKGFTLMSGMIN